jgi:hypothetical protein
VKKQSELCQIEVSSGDVNGIRDVTKVNRKLKDVSEFGQIDLKFQPEIAEGGLFQRSPTAEIAR